MEEAARIADWDHWPNQSQEVAETDTNPRFPNGIVVAILMLIGLLGNSVVLYVYHFKMEHTVFTTFVTFLAALDLITTLTSMPLDVIIKTSMVEKTEVMEVICKVAHFEVYTSSLASGSILLLIAATRYSKVCKPTQPAWTLRQARVWCLLIVLVAMALCTVALIINGLEKAKISFGTEDYYSRDLVSNFTKYTNGTISNHNDIPSINETAVEGQHELTQPNNLHPNVSHGTTQKVVEVYVCRASEQQKGKALYYVLYGLLMTAYVTICLTLLVLHCRISCTLVKFKRRQVRKGSLMYSHDHQNLNHITSGMFHIFVAITVIFIVSYLPHLACIIVQRTMFASGKAVPRVVRIFLDLAYNFPYINVVANPFIYGYMSKRFRSYCLHLLCPCCD